MSDTIKLKRTNNINNVQTTVLKDGEPLYDIRNNALYVGHDNLPIGGSGQHLNPIAGGSTLAAGDGINIANDTVSVNIGNGLEFDSSSPKKVKAKIVTTNGLKVSASGIDVNKASDSQFGTVKVTPANGLTINSGVVTLGTVTNATNAVNATNISGENLGLIAGNGITLGSDGKTISANVNESNGLSVDSTNGIQLGVAIPGDSAINSTPGAISAADIFKLNNINIKNVSYSPTLTTGQECGNIIIDNEEFTIFAPNSGSGGTATTANTLLGWQKGSLNTIRYVWNNGQIISPTENNLIYGYGFWLICAKSSNNVWGSGMCFSPNNSDAYTCTFDMYETPSLASKYLMSINGRGVVTTVYKDGTMNKFNGKIWAVCIARIGENLS